jgi:PTS system fructose-specific IIA component
MRIEGLSMSPSDHSILTSESIVLVGLESDSKVDATRQLAQLLFDDGRVTDLDGFLEDVAARELQMNTGLPGRVRRQRWPGHPDFLDRRSGWCE